AKHNDFVSVDFSEPQRRTLLAGGHEQSRTVWKSTDGGQNWTNIGTTMPEGTKFTTHPIFIDASTYLVNASGWGKGTGGVYGTTWKEILPPLPVKSAGVIYAPARQAFFIWQWDCGNQVLTNAIWRHEYRMENKTK